MIRMEGLFSESFGGTCTIRGYARYDEIVELSYPHPGYQRPVDDVHVGEISMFITSGSNSFSPEVVLAYTAKYDYYKEGAVSGIDAIADIRNGNGFTSNIDGISFKKIRKVNNGYLYEISIPYEKKLIDEEKPFRRVDGNHRLQAMEQLVSTGQISSTYLIPFLWGDRIFEKCGIGRDERGDGGKTLETRGKRRLSARDGGANYQQS